MHQVRFRIDNQTKFTLTDNKQYAQWGNFSETPVTVGPNTTEGKGGICQMSHGFVTGAAGIVGYTIRDSNGNDKLWLVFLGSIPWGSAEDNRAHVAADTNPIPTDKGTYYRVFENDSDHREISYEGGKLKINGNIGTANDATATFTLHWQKD